MNFVKFLKTPSFTAYGFATSYTRVFFKITEKIEKIRLSFHQKIRLRHTSAFLGILRDVSENFRQLAFCCSYKKNAISKNCSKHSKNYSKHKWFKLHRILSLKRQKITQMTQDLNWKSLRILWRLFLVRLYVFLNFDFEGVILFCTCVLLLDVFNRCSLFQLKK